MGSWPMPPMPPAAPGVTPLGPRPTPSPFYPGGNASSAYSGYTPSGDVFTSTIGQAVPKIFAQRLAQKAAMEDALQKAQLRAMGAGPAPVSLEREAPPPPARRAFKGTETVWGKYTTVAGQTFLEEVPAGTPGAHPIATLPAGSRAASMPANASFVGTAGPSPAGLGPSDLTERPPSGGYTPGFDADRLAAALDQSNADWWQRTRRRTAPFGGGGRTPPAAPKKSETGP